MPHVVLLLGKPPKSSTIFPEVIDRLAEAGIDSTVHLPHDEPVDPSALRAADLVVHRGLDATAMETVAELHAVGVRLVNPYPGTLRLADRVAMLRALDGLPVPATRVVHDWAQVPDAAGTGTCVVKSATGPGRGAALVVGTAEELQVDRGLEPPFLVQEYVVAGEMDHKLYLVGDEVRALLKPSPLAVGHTTGGAPFRPDDDLVDLAREVRRTMGLDFLGVDILAAADGPVVVDVNDFPGYRGIDDAAALVADHLARVLREG